MAGLSLCGLFFRMFADMMGIAGEPLCGDIDTERFLKYKK